MNFPRSFKPTVVGVVKDYPLYCQIYEDTKNTQLNAVQITRLGFQPSPDSEMKMFELQVPRSYLI